MIITIKQKNMQAQKNVENRQTYNIESKYQNILECRIHRKANSYGMPLSYTDKCECCNKFSQK